MPIHNSLSRRTFLRGLGVAGAAVRVGLPALDAMFNTNGTAYAAATPRVASQAVESRFVLWFKRQRDYRAILDSARDGLGLSHHALLDAACSASGGSPYHHRP